MIFFALAAASLIASAASNQGAIARLDPPEAGFYAKRLDCLGIPIKASAAVSDQALIEAHSRLYMMLHAQPDALANLRAAGAELHIFGRDQVPSDLPENKELKGKPFDGEKTIDQRTRGTGGLYASCGEENLLRLDQDRYAGSDICVHEFAHTMHHYGLSKENQKRITAQYESSLAAGLWKTTYAGKNESEFFAELSMWYFGTHGDFGKIRPRPNPGARWLRQYDHEAYDFLDALYTGALSREAPAAAPSGPVVLEKLSPSQEGAQKSYGGPETTVTFDNRTASRLKLYWLDGEGKRKSYGDLEPYNRMVKVTFVTHVWLVAGQDDAGLFIVVSRAAPGIVTIGDADLRAR